MGSGRTNVDRAVAYVDVAGDFGLVRAIRPETDHLIGTFAAVVLTPDMRRAGITALVSPFEDFRAAVPAGAKLHITDAFAPGNAAWAKVAVNVREHYIDILSDLGCPIVYAARRHRVARSLREFLANDTDPDLVGSPGVRVIGGERPDPERIDETVVKYLAWQLDALADSRGLGMIDILINATGDGVLRRHLKAIERTRLIGWTSRSRLGWTPATSEKVEATMRTTTSSPIPIEVRNVGETSVADGDDPLVLAADIVVNSINYHLRRHPPHEALHGPGSLSQWRLNHLVHGNGERRIEDIL